MFLAAVILCVFVGWFMVNVMSWTVALRRGITLHRFTLPGTRRLAQVLLAMSLSTACLAEADESPTMVLIEGEAGPTVEPTTTPASIPTSTATSTAPRPVDRAAADSAPAEPAPLDHAPTPTNTTPEVEAANDRHDVGEVGSVLAHDLIVRRGDNLWSLSIETLQRHGVADPSASTIASYWRLVIDANDVRSGNPDVIVAGETIHMPAHGLEGSTPSPVQRAVAVR